MSPEQATGSAVDGRTDCTRSAACSTRCWPATRPSPDEAALCVARRSRHATPEPISKRRPSVSPQPCRAADALPGEESRRSAADSRSAAGQTGHDLDHEGCANVVAPELAGKSRLAGSRGSRVASYEGCDRCGDAPARGTRAVFWPRATGAKPLDPNLVAVVPFRIAGADPSLAYLREGMLDLLGAQLTGDGGPRATDPRSVMSIWRRQVGDEHEICHRTPALLLARQLGAGRLLLGGIVGTQGPAGDQRVAAGGAGWRRPRGCECCGEIRQSGGPDRPARQRASRARGRRGNRTSGRAHQHFASGASSLPPGPSGIPARRLR